MDKFKYLNTTVYQPVLQATSPLSAWLDHLEQQHPKAIDLGLDRIGKIATRMDLLDPAAVVFTVAGTNGKGTTCRMLEYMLLESGLNVGVYSSPHLLHYTERLRIQGLELPEKDFCKAFACIEKHREGISLTYFEYSTLAALWLLKRARLDVAILEVGLGGRLDATNVVDTDIAIITSIGLDHTEWLGNDKESIGREKAGIFRSNKPAIVGERDIPESIRQVAQQTGARLMESGKQWDYRRHPIGWNYRDQRGEIYDLPVPQVPLENAATAIAAIRASEFAPRVTEKIIHQTLLNAKLTGRFQQISEFPCVIVDVAHNPHASAWLAQKLLTIKRDDQVIHAVVGMLRDKNIFGTLQHLAPVVNYWYCASLDGPRGASAKYLVEQLKEIDNNLDAETHEYVEQALHSAINQSDPYDIVIVFGSFHTVAHALQTFVED